MTVGAIYNIAAAKKQANTIYIYLPWFFGLCSNKQNWAYLFCTQGVKAVTTIATFIVYVVMTIGVFYSIATVKKQAKVRVDLFALGLKLC